MGFAPASEPPPGLHRYSRDALAFYMYDRQTLRALFFIRRTKGTRSTIFVI